MHVYDTLVSFWPIAMAVVSEGTAQPCSGSGEKYLSNHVYTHCHTYIYIYS